MEKARQQGRESAFLTSLESVGTIFGDGNLRGGLEFGIATGDFTALNDVFVELFSNSTQLVSTFGEGLQPLLIDMAENGVVPLTDKIKELQDAGASQIEVFAALGAEITLQITEAERLGVSLDPLITQYGDLVAETEGLTDSQKALLLAFIELEARPAQVAAALDELADGIQFLQDKGATSEQIFMIMGEALQATRDAAVDLGVELPPLVTEILAVGEATEDLGDVAEDTAEDIDKLAESIAAFDAGALDFVAKFEQGLLDASALSGEVTAAIERMMANGIDATTATERAFSLFSKQIIETFNDLTFFGEEIPERFQNLITLLTDIGLVQIDDQGFLTLAQAADEAAEAADRVKEAVEGANDAAGVSRRSPSRSRSGALDALGTAVATEEQAAALAQLQQRLTDLESNNPNALLGDDPFARQLRGGLTQADISAIQNGRLPGIEGGAAGRFGAVAEVIQTANEAIDETGTALEAVDTTARNLTTSATEAAAAIDTETAANNELVTATAATATAIQGFSTSVTSLATTLTGAAESIGNAASAAATAVESIPARARGARPAVIDIPALQQGGFIREGGLAFLHPNEVVVPGNAASADIGGNAIVAGLNRIVGSGQQQPAGGGEKVNVTMSPTINVSITGGEGMSPEELGNIVAKRVGEEFQLQGQRLVRREVTPALNTAMRRNTGGFATELQRQARQANV